MTVSAKDVEVGHTEHGGEVAREPCCDPGDWLRAGAEGAQVHAETACGWAGVVWHHGGVELEGAGNSESVVIDNPNLTVRVDEQFGGEECFSVSPSVQRVLCQQRGQPLAVEGELPQRHSDDDVGGVVVAAWNGAISGAVVVQLQVQPVRLPVPPTREDRSADADVTPAPGRDGP